MAESKQVSDMDAKQFLKEARELYAADKERFKGIQLVDDAVRARRAWEGLCGGG